MSTIYMIAIITHLLLIVYKLEFDNYTTDRYFFSLYIQNKAKVLTALFKILIELLFIRCFNFFFKICTTNKVMRMKEIKFKILLISIFLFVSYKISHGYWEKG